MKKSLILTLLLSGLSFAQADSVLVENFFKNGGNKTPEAIKLSSQDINLKNGLDYLESPEKMVSVDVDFTDPENKSAPKKIIKQTLPDYVKALKEFKTSFDKNKNSIAAYQGLVLIKTVFNKNKELEYFGKFSKALYDNEKNICTSYIDYGETLQYGYYQKIDIQKATQVYKEGLVNKNCTGWYKNVLAGKIDLLEMSKK